MNPTVITDNRGQKTSPKMSSWLITLPCAALIVYIGNAYPPVIFGLGVLALAYVALHKVRTPNRMHQTMDFLERHIKGFKMEPNDLFQNKTSPMDPVRNFTLTFRGECDLEMVRSALKVLFGEGFRCDLEDLRSGNFRAMCRKTPSVGFEVFSREHEKLPGLFRVRVERVFL